MSLIGPVKDGAFKRWLNHQITTSCFQVRSLGVMRWTFTCIVVAGTRWSHICCDHLPQYREQTKERNLCGQPHLAYRCDGTRSRQCLCSGKTLSKSWQFPKLSISCRRGRSTEDSWATCRPRCPRPLLRSGSIEVRPRTEQLYSRGCRSTWRTQTSCPSSSSLRGPASTTQASCSSRRVLLRSVGPSGLWQSSTMSSLEKLSGTAPSTAC